MQHLDEGTIHAWLDDALDATRSREIEAHLAQCPACSAAVAEARGLVAASSRILTALDDVPGGVMPKRFASPPAKVARRQWRAAPWVSGIAAAALLFAIGVKSVNKSAQVSLRDEASAPQLSVQTDTTAMGVDSAAPLSAPVSPARLATSGVTAPPPTAAVRRDLAANQAQTKTRPTDAAAVRPSVGKAASEGGGARVAAAPAAPPTEPLADVMKLEKAAVKTPAEQFAAAAADLRERRSDEESETARLAGCYRITPESRLQRAEGAVSGAAAVVGRAAQRGRAVAPAPAAADRGSQSYTTSVAPAIVRLDTARHPLGFAAREAQSDTLIGGWRNLGRDSARVDMIMVGDFVFALKNRVPCSER
jgi:anti-sigma factor RsiW